MTSGLFNTGRAGDSAEITSSLPCVQPAVTKSGGHDFSAENFDSSLDMNFLGDFQGFGDPLGDASMDCFVDLNALLGENTFLDQEETPTVSQYLGGTDAEDKVEMEQSFKRTFSEAELEVTPVISLVPTTVADIEKSPTHDHDYVAKRPRMSTLLEEGPASVEVAAEEEEEEEESVFLPPPSSPCPSTSQTTAVPLENKYRNRREKNNIASKRSREMRKMKFVNMEVEAERLQADNVRLEARIVELERLAKQMKEILVAKMAGK